MSRKRKAQKRCPLQEPRVQATEDKANPGTIQDGVWVVRGHTLYAVQNWKSSLNSEIGEGTDLTIGRPVVVKSPRLPAYSRFAKEFKLTGSFVHPHIIPILSLAFNEADQPAFIMPKIEGGTFRDAIIAYHGTKVSANDKLRKFHELLKHIVTIARTVHYAHTRSPAVLHRDLKPDNVLLDRDGNLYLADWGLGYRADEPEVPTPKLGTFNYAAPEQWEGKEQVPSIDHDRILRAIREHYPHKCQTFARVFQRETNAVAACQEAGVDFRELLDRAGYTLADVFSQPGRLADIYSLGAILYHAATGEPPFAKGSDKENIDNLHSPPEQINPNIDQELAKIIGRAMETTPEKRYQSADEFASDVERFMGRLLDEPMSAFKPGEEPLRFQVQRKVRRHPGLVAIVLACFGVLNILGALWTLERHIAVNRAIEKTRNVEKERDRIQDILNKATDDATFGLKVEPERRHLPQEHNSTVREARRGGIREQFLQHRDPEAGRSAQQPDRTPSEFPDRATRLSEHEVLLRQAIRELLKLPTSQNPFADLMYELNDMVTSGRVEGKPEELAREADGLRTLANEKFWFNLLESHALEVALKAPQQKLIPAVPDLLRPELVLGGRLPDKRFRHLLEQREIEQTMREFRADLKARESEMLQREILKVFQRVRRSR